MMRQEQTNPARSAYRPGTLELAIALGTLALVIGVGIGVILNQSVLTASIGPVPTVRPTRAPKPAARAKPTAQPAAISPRTKPTARPGATSPRAKPTAQAAKPTSARNAAAPAPTSAPPKATPAPPAAASTGGPGYAEYTVQKGDILKNLAQAYGVTIKQILAINTIENPDSLTIGEVIRIPKP